MSDLVYGHSHRGRSASNEDSAAPFCKSTGRAFADTGIATFWCSSLSCPCAEQTIGPSAACTGRSNSTTVASPTAHLPSVTAIEITTDPDFTLIVSHEGSIWCRGLHLPTYHHSATHSLPTDSYGTSRESDCESCGLQRCSHVASRRFSRGNMLHGWK